MAHAKFYNPSQNFKAKVIFRQYSPKKIKHLSTKIDKLCDDSGYTCDMKCT